VKLPRRHPAEGGDHDEKAFYRSCDLDRIGERWDVAAGATSFKKCAICHDVGTTAKNKVGPLLNGLDGRKSGTVAGYNYSDANKGSDITWNEESFLDYIKDPKAKIPNTKMAFAGIKNESEAKSLWCVYRKPYPGLSNDRIG
jgi:cytochrome c